MDIMDETKYVKDYSTFEQEYVELIYALQKKRPVARIKDIARLRDVASPTVTVAVDRLRQSGLVQHEKSGYVTLTEEGLRLAKRLERRHNLLREFFQKILGVEEDIAETDACNIEHILNKASIDNLERFLEFAKEHEGDNGNWLEEYINRIK
jgi:DtxR family Mn-dependent transcriptional regulator